MPAATLTALLFFALAGSALAGSPQAAPSPEEQRLFAEGLRAYEAGDARAAEKAWKAGYAIGHDAAFLVRIGEAQEKAGAAADAADSYRHYLREAPDAADRADIEQRLTRLTPATAPAAAPPAASPEGAETPGELGAGGAGARAPTGPPAPPGAGARAAGAVPATDAEGATRPAGDEDSGWNATNTTAWIAAAVTVTMLGAAGFFAASAASKKDDVNRLLNFHDDKAGGAPLEYSAVAQQYQSAVSDGQRLDRYAKLALLGAAGAAAIATAFFIVDATRTPERAPALSLAPRGAGALGALTWSF